MRNLILLFFLFGFFISFEALAIDEGDLVKVTPENNPKCVEYYNYQGEVYCSTKAIQNKPIDPELKNSEKLKIKFDEKPWQATWGKNTPQITTIEYIPKGDNINNWRELVTSQYLPGIQDKATPLEFANMMIKNLEESGFKPIITFIEKSPNRVIFEFRITSPENQKQDELQMITKDGNGLYILHYVIKESDMGKERRDKWVKNLKDTTITTPME